MFFFLISVDPYAFKFSYAYRKDLNASKQRSEKLSWVLYGDG